MKKKYLKLFLDYSREKHIFTKYPISRVYAPYDALRALTSRPLCHHFYFGWPQQTNQQKRDRFVVISTYCSVLWSRSIIIFFRGYKFLACSVVYFIHSYLLNYWVSCIECRSIVKIII